MFSDSNAMQYKEDIHAAKGFGGVACRGGDMGHLTDRRL
jgi:hypothetical protein